MFKKFTIISVLDDGETFSGAENATVRVFPTDKHMTADQFQDFQDGMIPETGELCSIEISDLLKQALDAKLPCVQELATRLGIK